MILLPTLNRIEKLTHFLESAIEAGTTEPGRILVDENDYEVHRSEYQALLLPEDWIFQLTKAVTMADKIREYWPNLSHRDYVMIVNDDHEIITPKWDKILVEALDGKNFTSANDRSARTFSMPVTATAWSMPLLNALGWPIYPPKFNHLFIDDVWRELGRATGCWRICANCVVLHNHVLFNAGEKDDTHSAVYGSEFPAKKSKMWDEDQHSFEMFMKHDFAEAVKKIRAFQDYLPGQQYRPPNS